MSISIIRGDATLPIGDCQKIIIHCCNDIGSFGSGFAGFLRKKWPHVATAYENWYEASQSLRLGEIKFCNAANGISVCHIIGQKGIGGETIDGVFIPPVRYSALYEGMLRVREKIHLTYASMKKQGNHAFKISVHSPLLGCRLAGGDLEVIYMIAHSVFGKSSIDFYFYGFESQDWEELSEVHKNFNLTKVNFVV